MSTSAAAIPTGEMQEVQSQEIHRSNDGLYTAVQSQAGYTPLIRGLEVCKRPRRIEVERKKIRPPAMNDNGKWNQLNDDVNINNYHEFGSSKKRKKKGQNKLRNRICIKSKSRLGKYTGGLQQLRNTVRSRLK